VTLPRLDPAEVRRMVDAALREDLGEAGDVTTAALVPADLEAAAHVVARGRAVLSGLEVAEAVFRAVQPSLQWDSYHRDGDVVEPPARVATVRGPAAGILQAERTALNFLLRMSGIATAARAAVEEVRGTGVRILDTRKTAPGLRMLDKYAVACGGADNHRMGLYDAAMIKDTHLGVAGSVAEAVRTLLAGGYPAERITAEVRTTDQLREAMAAGAGRALLDNMGLETLRECARIGKGKIVLEASGGLRPGSLRSVAETGIDCMSLGWLTHSSAAADLAMEMEPVGEMR
jgi:nicotinate-nucleotide pyrophosphorylase (carboxylating)